MNLESFKSMDIEALRSLPPAELVGKKDELSRHITALASHIDKKNALLHALDGSLQGVESKTASLWEKAFSAREEPPIPSMEVLEDLQLILFKAREAGLSESHKEQLHTIRKLCDAIIISRPPANADAVLKDLIPMILAQTSGKTAVVMQRVAKRWKTGGQKVQFSLINEEKIKFKDLLSGITSWKNFLNPFRPSPARQVVDWIIKNPSSKQLEYADFTGLDGFDNECLDLLTQHCPNLKDLIVPWSKISGNALEYLQRVPQLEHLDLFHCIHLAPNALDNLEHIVNLKYLDVSHCTQLNPRMLDRLFFVRNLEYLRVNYCNLEPSALENLKSTPDLRHLDISYCQGLKADALQELAYVPELDFLNLDGCSTLEADCLQNLGLVAGLRYLHAGHLQLSPDALKNLEMVPQLLFLDLEGSSTLEADALQHLINVPKLVSLNVNNCSNLQADSLKHLEFVPNLLFFYLENLRQLEGDALKHLDKVPNLLLLDVIGQSQLLEGQLQNLGKVPHLNKVYIEGANLPYTREKDIMQFGRPYYNFPTIDQHLYTSREVAKIAPNLITNAIARGISLQALPASFVESKPFTGWGTVAEVTAYPYIKFVSILTYFGPAVLLGAAKLGNIIGIELASQGWAPSGYNVTEYAALHAKVAANLPSGQTTVVWLLVAACAAYACTYITKREDLKEYPYRL